MFFEKREFFSGRNLPAASTKLTPYEKSPGFFFRGIGEGSSPTREPRRQNGVFVVRRRILLYIRKPTEKK